MTKSQGRAGIAPGGSLVQRSPQVALSVLENCSESNAQQVKNGEPDHVHNKAADDGEAGVSVVQI